MSETARPSRWFRGLALTILLLAGLTSGCDGSSGAGIILPSNGSPRAVISANPTQVPAGDNHTTVVTLDGSGSSDPDGDPITFAWAIGSSGQFVNGTTLMSMVPQVTFPGAGSYTVILTVRDNRGGIGTSSFTITTASSNNPPNAVATERTR